MTPRIKILHVDSKWTSIRYVNSNAKSRIKTEQLKSDFENGILDVVNPQSLK